MRNYILTALFLMSLFCSCKTQQQDRAVLTTTLKKVADWQIEDFKYSKDKNLHDYGLDSWTNGVLYIGMEEWAGISNDTTYYNWLHRLGTENEWRVAANFKNYPKYSLYHADELCVSQMYLAMYKKHKEKNMIKSTEERVDWIMSNPPSDEMSHKSKQSWTWCDALFMAPPVYIQLAELKKDKSYIEYMAKEFKKTYYHLYDIEESLFFRDDSYFAKKEANGQKIFWGRGNGWVVAGLANMLKHLPANSEYRPFYESLFKKMLTKLVTLQDPEGFWHASLLDPQSYPSPETSASAMITYALAYGVNNGLLDKKKYQPIVKKSWKALVSVVDDNGKLGYVQPIGADPKKVTSDMTAVYGVGAFLLAGSEIYQMK